MDFLAVKVDGSDVKSGICEKVSCREIPDLTSLPSTLTAKYALIILLYAL